MSLRLLRYVGFALIATYATIMLSIIAREFSIGWDFELFHRAARSWRQGGSMYLEAT